jgi:hypothetical protein
MLKTCIYVYKFIKYLFKIDRNQNNVLFHPILELYFQHQILNFIIIIFINSIKILIINSSKLIFSIYTDGREGVLPVNKVLIV